MPFDRIYLLPSPAGPTTTAAAAGSSSSASSLSALATGKQVQVAALSMEEHTLKLAQKIAREISIQETQTTDEESNIAEARDAAGPMPLKSMAAKLEEKVKGFR